MPWLLWLHCTLKCGCREMWCSETVVRLREMGGGRAWHHDRRHDRHQHDEHVPPAPSPGGGHDHVRVRVRLRLRLRVRVRVRVRVAWRWA